MFPIDFEITNLPPKDLSTNYIVFKLKEEIMKGESQSTLEVK